LKHEAGGLLLVAEALLDMLQVQQVNRGNAAMAANNVSRRLSCKLQQIALVHSIASDVPATHPQKDVYMPRASAASMSRSSEPLR
jgi:hypothetical protein